MHWSPAVTRQKKVDCGTARWVNLEKSCLDGLRGILKVKSTGCGSWFGYELGKEEVAAQADPPSLTPTTEQRGWAF